MAQVDSTIVVAGLGVLGIAITAYLGWLGTRGNNTETRRMSDRERLEKLEGDVTSLRGQIDTLRGQLTDLNTRWSAVTGTIQQILWDWFRDWPEGHPRPILALKHMQVLRDNKVEHIIPAGAQPDTGTKENP